MKKIFLALMAVAAIVLTSCNSKLTVDTLSGSWVITDMTWEVAGQDTSAIYVEVIVNNLEQKKEQNLGNYGIVFSEDGKLATSDGDLGTWKLSGNTVLLNMGINEDGTDDIVQFKYKDDELVWVDDRLAGDRNQDLKNHGITKYVVTMTLNKRVNH